MKRIVVLTVALCLMLSGCSQWMSSSYSSVESHTETNQQESDPALTVSSYSQLCKALITLVRDGQTRGALSVLYAEENEIRADMDQAIEEICRSNPFAVYTVEEISYECGSGSGGKTVSVRITYLQDRARADRIQRVQNAEQANWFVIQQLEACEADAVLYVDTLERLDYDRIVREHAIANPHTVMEIPQVSVSYYPEDAQQQIVEIKFTYQTNREELRVLRNKVSPVFASAQQHTTGNYSAMEKLSRLYSFLMGRYDEYTVQTSITPTYSLLLHGEGDSQAFAMVYGAMCRQAGIECRVVIGTYNGEPWAWNAVEFNGEYYYIDLLRCSRERQFRLRTSEEMAAYQWDRNSEFSKEIS